MMAKNRRTKMLRKLIIISVVSLSTLVFSRIGFCVPAVPLTQQLEQPDGNTFNARLWGDERAHGWETTDGYTIIEDADTKIWRYAQKEASTGRMLPAGIVGDENAQTGLSRHLRPAKSTNLRSAGNTVDRMQPRSVNHTPVAGSRPIPVMMVNFSNTSTTFDSTDFANALFGTGTNSLKDYYEEVSYGAFSVTPGTAGVTGWYNAANAHDYYGQNDASGYDSHPAELVIETVSAADAAIDFSEYDADGDCYVDAVVIVHQGSGEEAGGPTGDIWSHQWDLFSAEYFGDGTGVYTTNDVAACGNIKIKDYVIQPETLYGDIQTVGVFAHEYGHVLGLPDLYDIDYSSNGIGNWGLMSGGAWGSVLRPGDSPVHLSAWSKYMLGWIDPVTVTTRLADETIGPASAYDDVYQFFPDNDITSQEYYLIENRQRTGFDAGLPGTGLAIWHIDENKASSSNHDNSYECAEPSDCTNTHYRVALVQADGYWDLETGYNRGDTGDLYPGASGNTDFTSTSGPGSLLYDGAKSHVDITDITETGTTITASLALTYAITPSATSGGTITPGSKTTLDLGGEMTFAIAPQAGYQISQVYIDGASVGAVSEYTFSDTQVDHAINAVFTSTTPSGGGSGGGGGCFISSTFLMN
jgi:immune inhibitor A